MSQTNQARLCPRAAGRHRGDPRPIENERPGPDELIDRGELDELVPMGNSWSCATGVTAEADSREDRD